MKAQRYGANSGAKSWQDICDVTGLGREGAKAAIIRGDVPGYLIGERYIVPAEAFDAFCRGEWTPRPRPVPTPAAPPEFIHSRKSNLA